MNNQYKELSKKYFNEGNYLLAVSYIDIALATEKSEENKLLKSIFTQAYLNEIKSYSYTQNKIAVYAITKNEIKYVDQWYKSMSEADYICILDTGSTDGTYERFLELAKQDSRVIISQCVFTPWRFDLPRNVAMDLIPRDANILLSTDLDELLEPGWGEDLRTNWIQGQHIRATYQYAWSHNPSGAPGRIFWYNKVHDWKWIWRYPVHELLYNLETNSEQYDYQQECHLNKMFLHHYPDQTKSRGNYLPLLEQRAQEDETDYYGMIYLSHEYNYRGFYQKSIDTLNKTLTLFKARKGDVISASCYLFMGDDYSALGNNEKAEESYKKAIEYCSDYREPYLNLGDVYIKQNKYQDAINIIEEGLRKSYRHYSWVERDISWTYQPFDLLCLAYYYNGDKVKSLACAYKACQIEPGNERLENNLKLVLNNISDKEW